MPQIRHEGQLRRAHQWQEDSPPARPKGGSRVGQGFLRGRPAGESRDAVAKVTGEGEVLRRHPARGNGLCADCCGRRRTVPSWSIVDASGVEAVRGAKVVRDGELMAVLHATPDGAERAIAGEGRVGDARVELDEDSIFEHLVKVAPAGEVVASGGDLAVGRSGGEPDVRRTYFDGYVAHAADRDPHRDRRGSWTASAPSGRRPRPRSRCGPRRPRRSVFRRRRCG